TDCNTCSLFFDERMWRQDIPCLSCYLRNDVPTRQIFYALTYNPMLKKIAIIGPESTGKSTLCEQLAEHYNTLWCPEYAREYLLEHGMDYTYDDLLTIAKGQVELEEKYIQLMNQRSGSISGPKQEGDSPLTTHDSRLLFIDTDMYVMKVWCEFVFGKCHQ